jgi:hypothetical protein
MIADKKYSSPKAVLRVGNVNDVGKPQLSSLIVTTKGAAAGAVVIEWNVNGGQMWGKTFSPSDYFHNLSKCSQYPDVHVKLGGTPGSSQTSSECPSTLSGTDREKCRVAALMFHITPKASGYFESMLLTVADTDYQGVRPTHSHLLIQPT